MATRERLMVPAERHSRDEIVAYIDDQARKRLKTSARDMLRAWREGRLDVAGEVADLLVLADMLPEDDPLFAPAR